MTQLKTLKDFGENNSLDYDRPTLFKDTFVYDDLRTEAVKWVKRRIKFGNLYKMGEDWQTFFNLTEEDFITTDEEEELSK